jgi:signal transduction histidine kinase/CheY-like chemotaxis protein
VFAYLYYTLLFVVNQQISIALYSTFAFFTTLLVVSVRRIPLKFRVAWLLLVFYLTGCILLFAGAYTLPAMLFFLSYSIMAVTVAGWAAALRSLAFNALALLAGGFYWHSTGNQPSTAAINISTYIDLSVSFVLLNLVITIPLISMVNGLVFNLNKEKRYQSLLSGGQTKLEQAIKKAEESDQLKTAFLSNMSHEIRTPMNAILGFSNLLSHPEIGSPEKEEFVELIKHNGNCLMTLVDDIIDISKIESGQFRIKNGTCQLHQLLDDIHRSFTEDMLRRGISNIQFYLKKGISETNIQILIDGPRLEKVLSSLLSNAIKFTDKGFIEFGYKHTSNQYLEFYVKDTGIGLPKGKEKEVFNRFYKGQPEHQRLYGGTGIGLTIAQNLVELMGGEIWVESQPMAGTSVYFTIPFQRLGSAPGAEPTEKTHAPINWEGKTFLVAEDEEDNFRYLEVALSLSKASLIWARDGEEAVDLFQKSHHIDLVLMDIKMPKMDGYQATHAIKAIKPEVPVIAQTAYSLAEEKDKSIKAGCDGYIAKPINYKDLLNLIQQSLLNRDLPSA